MKKLIVLSLLCLFLLAVVSPVTAFAQEPQKTETSQKSDEKCDKKECKKDCKKESKKKNKKECKGDCKENCKTDSKTEKTASTEKDSAQKCCKENK